MNMNSYICQFIHDHPDNWEQILSDLGIGVKRESNLAIFNYHAGVDFFNPVVQEARGIIIDLDSLDVVCWPFRKFGNVQEAYADKIDWSTARVQEKIDGSIVKLWWHPVHGWFWSSNSCIDAAGAALSCGRSVLSLIRAADNFAKISADQLDKDCTYIFELTGPENQVVVHYDRLYLYHIGTRNNKTGEESNQDIGIQKPAEYPLHTLKDCIEAVRALNREDGPVEHEGFVVVDADWHRVKVKSPEYLELHHVIANRTYNKAGILRLVLSGEDMEEFANSFPDAEPTIRWYQYQVSRFREDARRMIRKARGLYEEYSHERKAVAADIKDSPYAVIGFMALDLQRTEEDMLAEAVTKYAKKYVKEEPDAAQI